MNVFELLLFWLASVCGLSAFRAVEAKAGFWVGSVAFVAVACGAWFSLQFFVKMFSGKSRGGGMERRDGRSAAGCRTPGRGAMPVSGSGGAASSRALPSNEFAGGRDGGRKQEKP